MDGGLARMSVKREEPEFRRSISVKAGKPICQKQTLPESIRECHGSIMQHEEP